MFNCDKLFRRTKHCLNIDNTMMQPERTYWSLIVEVLARYSEGLKKDEIIDKIGYCSSQCEVWQSLKHWGYIEKIPHSWKMRVTPKGLNHITKVFEENGLTFNPNGIAERVQLLKMAEVQGRINTINKEFKNA